MRREGTYVAREDRHAAEGADAGGGRVQFWAESWPTGSVADSDRMLLGSHRR
jgi:hypothetical protein